MIAPSEKKLKDFFFFVWLGNIMLIAVINFITDSSNIVNPLDYEEYIDGEFNFMFTYKVLTTDKEILLKDRISGPVPDILSYLSEQDRSKNKNAKAKDKLVETNNIEKKRKEKENTDNFQMQTNIKTVKPKNVTENVDEALAPQILTIQPSP